MTKCERCKDSKSFIMGGMKTRCLCPDVYIKEAIEKAESAFSDNPIRKIRKKRKDWAGNQNIENEI